MAFKEWDIERRSVSGYREQQQKIKNGLWVITGLPSELISLIVLLNLYFKLF